MTTTNSTPLQRVADLIRTTEHIRDMIENDTLADAFDALVTLLHAARAIDPDNAVGADLESSLDWCEMQMRASVDMRKALLNMIQPIEDFAFDMDNALHHAA